MSDFFDGGPASDEPPRRGAAHLAVGRAVAIVVVGLIVGILLIGVASRSPQPATVATPTTTPTPTTTTPTTLPGTTSTVPHASVSVVVENGTSVNGAASTYCTSLTQQGWTACTTGNAPKSASSSAIYYASGYKPAALEVALAIGQKTPVVEALTTGQTAVTASAGSDVIVLLGADLASTPPPTTSTTTSTAAG